MLTLSGPKGSSRSALVLVAGSPSVYLELEIEKMVSVVKAGA